MDGMFIGVIAILCAVGLPVVTGLVLGVQLLKGRHEERMGMIEKGIVLEEPEKKANRYPALRNGIFMIGLAVGIIIGIFMGPAMSVSDWFDITIPTMALLFGGISFVIYFFLARVIQRKEEAQDSKTIN